MQPIILEHIKASNLSHTLLKQIGIVPDDTLRLTIEVEGKDEYDEWDLQMAEDANSGRLDTIADQALADFHAGKCDKFP